jgi:hypothetical protein
MVMVICFGLGLVGFRHVHLEYAIPEGRLNAILRDNFPASRSTRVLDTIGRLL